MVMGQYQSDVVQIITYHIVYCEKYLSITIIRIRAKWDIVAYLLRWYYKFTTRLDPLLCDPKIKGKVRCCNSSYNIV